MTALAEIDRTGPLVLLPGYGWPLYPHEVEQREQAQEHGLFDVRTPEQEEIDDWVRGAHWARQSVPYSFLLPDSHPCQQDFYRERVLLHEECHAIILGGMAPTEEHARRLARSYLRWYEQFVRAMSEERAAYLAVCVLDGWHAAHG